MIIVFGRPIQFDGMRASPVFAHISGAAVWRDTLSHDASLIMSEIETELSPAMMDAIESDSEVLYIVDFDPEPPEPGPESGDSGERNPDKKISQTGFGNIISGARRHGIPEGVIDADMTYEMVANVFRQKMIVDQALGSDSLDELEKVAIRIKDKLERAGIDIDIEVESPKKLLKETLKKEKIRRGNLNKR